MALDIQWDDTAEKDADGIFAAFNRLSESKQAEAEADFQDINALAVDGGIQALIDEAAFHEDTGFAQEIAKIEGLQAKAFWAFMERQNYWPGASKFLHADNVSASMWRKRKDLPKAPPAVEDKAIAAFEKAISAFFYQNEGRGRNCKAEVYRRYQQEYFFVYPEDYARTGVEWIQDNLSTRARHPAFEIILVYCQNEGSLDIYAPRNTKAVPDLQRLFAKHILGLEALEDGTIDRRVYDLSPLRNPAFEFQIEPDSGISAIVVTHIRVTLKGSKTQRRVKVEADSSKDSQAVYRLLESLTLPPYFVTQVGLKATLEPVNGRRARTRRFNITYPNICGLNYEGSDRVIRDILIKSGIEPCAPDQVGDS